MTTQKEFHELMRQVEDEYNISVDTVKFVILSRVFIPLAIDRIKRLERALELTEDQFIEWDSNRQRDEFRQIKKELGE